MQKMEEQDLTFRVFSFRDRQTGVASFRSM